MTTDIFVTDRAGQPPTLVDLAQRINQEHLAADSAGSAFLAHARTAGELLLQVKEQLPHGDFTPWVRANFQGRARTARAYMQISRRWPEIEAKRQRAATLSAREAIKLLSPVKPAANEKRFLDLPLDVRQQTCRRWWDILQSYTLLLDAAGWPLPKIAETFGVESNEVTSILDPRPRTHHFTELYREPYLFARHYANAVRAQVHRHFALGYMQAVACAGAEGLEEVVPFLWASRARHQHLAETLQEDEDIVLEVARHFGKTAEEGRTYAAAMYCCVTDDVREALLIAPPAFNQDWNLIHLMRWAEVCEQAQALEGN